MSNTTQGRFKSKALSYVYSKTRAWVDECEKALRQAKITVAWGAKLALSPLYALFRASQMVGHQLQGTVRDAVLRLPFGHPDSRPAADAPIQTVVNLLGQLVVTVPAIAEAGEHSLETIPAAMLEAESLTLASLQAFIPEAPGLNPFQPSPTVPLWKQAGKMLTGLVDRVRQGWRGMATPLAADASSSLTTPSKPSILAQIRQLGHLKPAQPEANDLTASRLKIQGVASQLATRELVLVSLGNQILDILSPTQKHQLQARIIWEIADYWQKRKRQERRFQAVSSQVGALQAAGTQALGWAKSVLNHPGSQLALPGQTASSTVHPVVAIPLTVVTSIWEALQPLFKPALQSELAALPGQAPQSSSSLALLPAALLQPLWHQLQRLPLIRALWPQGGTTELPKLPGSSPQTAFGMLLDFGLIRFFTQRFQTQQLWQWQQPAWLTLRDLGGTDLESDAEAGAEAGLEQMDWAEMEPWHRGGIWSWLSPLKAFFRRLCQPLQWIWQKGFGFPPALPAAGQFSQPDHSPNLRSRRHSRLANGQLSLRQALVDAAGNQPVIHQPVTIRSMVSPTLVPEMANGFGLEFNPDWIEVESTAIGYVKSPLEQILDALDQLFLWIETVAVALWNRVWNWFQNQFRP